MAKYKKYSEYKDSGITWTGQVPSHWSLVRFKHVLAEKKKTSNPSLPSGSISFGEVVYKSDESISPETKASYQEVLQGEFLVNPLNMNYDLLSLRTALSSIDVVVSTGYIVLKSNARLNKRYARWLLQEFDVAHMKTLGSGVRQTINYTDIGNSFFFEVPESEQKQIARFLDHETGKIDRLIQKQQQLIELLKEKRQAVISHAVTKGLNPNAPLKPSNIEWLGNVPEHWKVSQLRHYVETINGFGFSSTDFKETGVPFIRAGNIKNKSVTFPSIFLPQKVVAKYKRVILQNGDIVISMVGSDPTILQSAVGQVGIVPSNLEGAVPNQNTVIMRENAAELVKKYLFYTLCSTPYRNHLNLFSHKLANQSIISSSLLVRASFAFPSVQEQQLVVDFLDDTLSKFDKTLGESEKAITLLKERRTALISAAVTGKIDVRDWQPPAEGESGEEKG